MDTYGSDKLYVSLSERESEIIHLLAEGLSNRDIAQKLMLSLETIKWYNRQIYGKLDVSRRTQAVARARELGLIGREQVAGPGMPSLMAEVTGDVQVARSLSNTPGNLPAFLTLYTDETSSRPRFVGRELELARLQYFLGEALQGKGQPIFIDGGTGTGKTSLLTEFTRHALEVDPGLLAVTGSCSALAGIGDPYLPFRELAALLGGDLEIALGAGTILHEQARRLWLAIPQMVSTLLEKGPNLLNVFVPGASLLARARLVTSAPVPWLSQLEENVRSPRQSNLDQGAVISEFSEFLLELARHHPLLLMLDDLHWADDASLALLFHLSRHLSGSRILIVGTYRPEALADGLGRKRHPLKEVLTELQRTYGHIIIDIETKEQSESRKFIDALLDSEPNQLNQSFRAAFFQKTGGHPLFCVELLHEMQERGDLVQNEAGEWCAGDSMDWQEIPARVEAVIGQRLGHLDAAIRGVLQAASVEGETFTAEIIAEVCQFDKRELVAIFSRDLIRQHRLLTTQGIERLVTQERQLTRYRFRHHLFQAYLYQELDEIERSYLHEAVGVALENLYGDLTGEIAVQLARHFQEAHNLPKGIKYLRLASERATRLFAYEEAVAGFRRALELALELPPLPESNEQMYRLYMDLGLAQRKASMFENSLNSFQKAADIAREQGSVEELAQAALAYEESRWRVNLPPATSVALLTEALHNLGGTNRILQARVWVNRAWALMPIISPDQAEQLLQQALEMARQVNDPLVLFDALYLNVRRNRRPESSSERMEMLAEMLSLAETLGSFERIGDIYAFRLLEHLERGDIDSFTADGQYFAGLLSKKIHQPFYVYDAMINTVLMTMLAGHFEVAERLVGEALEKGRQMGVDNYDGVYSMQMFTIRREQGRLRELAPLVRLIVSQNAEASVWKPGLALLYVELDMRSEAQAEFEGLAGNEFDALRRDALWVTSLVYLSEVCAYLGDAKRATILYRLLSNYNGRNVVVGHKAFCLGAAARYLGLLAATRFDLAAAKLHFEDAITMNERMGAHSWLAHTRYDYAALLLAQGQPIDKTQAEALLGESLSSAEALGMHALVEKIETLKGNF